MSLNGLDDVKVREAYDAAGAEPGGWFLLKYISRDEVELLGRGNGGIVEIRNAIAQYEEPSPLYGFLRYRRRNVIIKYMPEDCSRLIQARVAVHFTAVTEQFAPHDTVFSISSSKELLDSKLSAACSLHTASESISSSTSSLRRRRLMEIAEEEEENRAKRQSTVPEELSPSGKASSVSGTQAPRPAQPQQLVLPTETSLPIIPSDRSLPPTPRELRDFDVQPLSPTHTIDEPRKSLQLTRPEIYTSTSYGSNGKPKIKLGPRPSLDTATAALSHFRPVSTLPAGLKLFKSPKKGQEAAKAGNPSDRPSIPRSPPSVHQNNKFPQMPPRPHTSGGRSSKPFTAPSNISPKSPPAITPEKARLMKALQLRKNQMNASAATAPPSPGLSEGPLSPPIETQRSSSELSKDENDSADDVSKANDSGIAFDTRSALKTDESDATRSDSYPVSPIGPSERAESTRASSVSGSTDETVQDFEKPKSEPSDLENNSEEKIPEAGGDNVSPEDPTSIHQNNVALSDPEPTTEPPKSAQTDTSQLVPSSVSDSKEETPANMDMAKDREEPAAASESPMAVLPAVQDVPETLPSTSETPETEHSASLSDISAKTSVEDMNDLPPPGNLHRLSIGTKPPPSASPVALIPVAKSPVESSFSIDTKRSLTEDNDLIASKGRKRRGLVEPIRTDVDWTDRSTADSDANFSSDDDFMDELQSAVVQEAKPISVSKSPVSPVFPTTKPQSANGSRASSVPRAKDSSEAQWLTPPDQQRPATARSLSASATYLNHINQQPAKLLAKKVNLGSGISQRIKALEKLSTTTAANPAANMAPGPSASFFSVRKGSGRGNSRSPSIAERQDSLTRNTPSPTMSRESSPEAFKLRDRSESVQSRVDAFRGNPIPLNQPQRARPETISVTAHIVRDPMRPFPQKSEAGKDPSEYSPLNLKQSPLVIDHQKANILPIKEPPKETIQERRKSNPPKTVGKERRSSFTIVKELFTESRASKAERRRSIANEASVSSPTIMSPSYPPSVHTPQSQRPMSVSSRRSRSSREFSSRAPSRALSQPPTPRSESSASDEKADKKSSRASRMLKRMSSLSSSSRKIIVHAKSPTVREESESPRKSISSSQPEYSSTSSTAPHVNIGDVNVQFPDTLLWKRRSMLLDGQGFLILVLTSGGNGKDKAGVGATRRFHFSEFRTPSIPDVEMQELPNSVVLDFVEGGGLQVACEDRASQEKLLKVLQEAHRSCIALS